MKKTSVVLAALKNPQRPNALMYINYIFKDFIELCGDRLSSDDKAITTGIAFLDNSPVTVIGQLRGLNLSEQIKYNFSMTSPSGFRKSLRIMKQSEKFGRPIICFVDTVGAYPGVEAEENCQSYAIAENLALMQDLKIPIITVLIGNGCSGGALALCVADKIIALENAILSVISPKAYAEIKWKDSSKEEEAAKALKLTSENLHYHKIVDYIIPEHTDELENDFTYAAEGIKSYLKKEIETLRKIDSIELIESRKNKYRAIK